MKSTLKKIRVDLGRRGYDIAVCYDKVADLGRYIKPLNLGTDAVIITSSSIKRLFGYKVKRSLASSGFNVRFATVPDGEKAKSERYCIGLLNSISMFDGSRRRIFIVALGGGVIGDLGGFVASIYRRGIPHIQAPTTLLAQVDSAIGGKVAIDLAAGKNLAGAFYQPRFVFSDVSFLKTLARKELISGLGEVIKYGIIRSPQLFSFLEKNYKRILRRDKKSLVYIIQLCSSIKAEVVEKDEYDNKNIRVILNMGHTIGHAIETASGYSRSYSHGEAIALGTIAASYLSKELGLLDGRVYLRIKELMKRIGLPVSLKGLEVKDVFKAQEHDKKFIHGRNRFVLPVKIGKAIVKENIPRGAIVNSIASLL